MQSGAEVEVELDSERREDVRNIRSVVAAYAVYWHKLAVDTTVFIATGCITLCGFAMSRSDASQRFLFSLSALLLIFGWGGAFLCTLIKKNYQDHQHILVRLDRINRLFETDLYVKGESIYPARWSVPMSKKSSDPIFRFCISVLLMLPILLIAVIYFGVIH